MSEAAATEAPKKKKGKLPIIIALVAVLAGGGFFMTKKKGPEKAHTVELAAVETPIEDEFLVNMSDGRTYVRTKIAVILRKDYKPDDWTKHAIEVADAVNMALKTTDPAKTNSEADMKILKRKIAASINKAIGGADEHEGEGGKKEEAPKKTTVVNLDEKGEKGHGDEKEKQEIPPDWDSLEGPVLKVLFASFATQA